MIKEFETENFQAHKLTHIEFSDGVNVIKGTSHHGKSSIIRALRWIIENQPRGAEFKSWFAGTKDKVTASIVLDDDAYVSRERKGKTGSGKYITPIDTYEAMGDNVPEEVYGILQMDHRNIHSQDDGYFLISLKPREVAKLIGDAAGLGIIEEVTGKVNSIISGTTSDIRYAKKDIEELTENLKRFENLDKIVDLTNQVKVIIGKHQELCVQMNIILNLISDTQRESDVIQKCRKKIKLEQYIDIVLDIQMQKKVLEEKHQSISNIITSISKSKSTIEDCQKVKSLEPIVNEIFDLQNKKKEMAEVQYSIASRLNEIDRLKKSKDEAIAMRSLLSNRLRDKLIQMKICESCGSEITDKNIEKVIAWKLQ
uniref:Putative ATPase domain containing protein n=1 Tax=viral metagenome TaxID=1070528 RepID=A0A6M3JW84_9ZZZZ